MTSELRIQGAVPIETYNNTNILITIRQHQIIPHIELHSCDWREAEEKMPRITVSTQTRHSLASRLLTQEAVPIKTQNDSDMLIRLRQHQNRPTSWIEFRWTEVADEKMSHQKLRESHTTFDDFKTRDTRDYPNNVLQQFSWAYDNVNILPHLGLWNYVYWREWIGGRWMVMSDAPQSGPCWSWCWPSSPGTPAWEQRWRWRRRRRRRPWLPWWYLTTTTTTTTQDQQVSENARNGCW